MNQIKYMFKDIKNNRLMSLLLLCLCVVMMLIFTNLFEVLYHTQASLENIEQFRDTKAFIVQDSTDELQLQKIFSDEQAISKMEKFVSDIKENDVKFFTQFSYDMDISENGVISRQERVSNNFFELFGIETIEGRLFTQEEYDKVMDTVPIIVGYNLNSEYQVGEEYEFYYAGTGEPFTGKIVGRLQKNSTYMEFNNSYEMEISLDNSYIIPLGLKDYQNEKMSFSDWDMALTSMVYFVDDMQIINEKIEEMDLFELTLLNIQDRFEDVIEGELNYLYVIVTISMVLFLCVLFIMWIIFHRWIKRQLYEYSIHLLCGAKKTTIIIRMLNFIYLMLSVAIIVVCIWTKSVSQIFAQCGVMLLLGGIILIYPVCKLNRFRISQIMKNS